MGKDSQRGLGKKICERVFQSLKIPSMDIGHLCHHWFCLYCLQGEPSCRSVFPVNMFSDESLCLCLSKKNSLSN